MISLASFASIWFRISAGQTLSWFSIISLIPGFKNQMPKMLALWFNFAIFWFVITKFNTFLVLGLYKTLNLHKDLNYIFKTIFYILQLPVMKISASKNRHTRRYQCISDASLRRLIQLIRDMSKRADLQILKRFAEID